MQNKIIGLLAIFVLLFILDGFCQASDSSLHPLLDKYYPGLKKPVPSGNTTTQIQQTPAVQPEPVVQATPVVSTPIVKNIQSEDAAPALNNNTRITNTRSQTITPLLANIPDNPDTSQATTKPVATKVPTRVTTPSLTTTATISNPAIVTATLPVMSQTIELPPPPPYRDTRLGSSTPQYDTWQKNNNGAGSVTTSPK